MAEKPILIFDGDCHFCRCWIERWRLSTGDRVDYVPYQEVLHLYPDIKKEQFKKSVQLVESGRRFTSGAQAVFRALAVADKKWPLVFYEKLPWFRTFSEWFYQLVAENRKFFSTLTRLLWGPTALPSTYHFSTQIFLSFLGLIYAAAFISVGVQVLGLYGSQGILPVADFLARIHQDYGAEAYWNVPSVFWLASSDAWLQGACWAGAGLSLLFALGILRPVTGLLIWALYLSLFSVGQRFLSYQWDILLLETGFLAILLPKFRWFSAGGRSGSYRPIIHFFFLWLLFRLMFSSGIVKILSEDTAWATLTALDFHFETQPLPTWVGYHAHYLPEVVHKLSVFMMFVIELVLPFLIFLPRRLKIAAALPMILFQCLIILTGNYCFFNLLTIALCLLLFDDGVWPRYWQQKIRKPQISLKGRQRLLRTIVLFPILGSVLLMSVVEFSETLQVKTRWPRVVVEHLSFLRPLRLSSSYGLFAVITTTRDEIVIEGSNDGRTWSPYEFKYKPGSTRLRPKFIAPHQPRLDWQMWFASLSDYRQNPWLVNFCVRLLEGSEPVISLLAKDSFPARPPKFIRAAIYSYQFTDQETREQTGHWWERRRQGLYMKTLSLKG